MGNWIRMTAAHKAEIAASAQDAWDLLTDFGGVLRYWPEDVAPIPIERVELEGRHGEVPRKRHVYVRGGYALEALYLEDHEARRIYYDMNNDGIPGVRNYLATTVIDASGPETCLMSFSSHFDIPAGSDADLFRERVEVVYRTLAEGFRRHFALPPEKRSSPTYLA